MTGPRVQRVLAPAGGESWTVIGRDRRPVEPIERYLAWLTRIERSPNTVRAYARDLKTFRVFLEGRDLRWDQVTLEQVGQFTGWLRQPAENVIVLASGTSRRSASTVNRMLAAVFGFYEFHARHGLQVARALVDASRSGLGGYKPLLHGRHGCVGAQLRSQRGGRRMGQLRRGGVLRGSALRQ